MCKAHDEAVKAALEFLQEHKHKRFTIGELMDKVLEKAGTTYVSPRAHIKDWLEGLRKLGVIEKDGKYYEYKPEEFRRMLKIR